MWDAVSDVDLRLDLEAATARLTAKQVEAMRLYLAGYTQAEIGEHIGTKRTSVEDRLMRAIANIAAVLGDDPSKTPRKCL